MEPRVTRLESGLRIATIAMPHLHSVAFNVSVLAGAINEPDQTNGLAHLLEHMVFKGTERRNARAIAEEMEAVGADLNAYTGRSITSYHMRALAEHLDLGVDVISDLLCHAKLETKELERERGVVLQEIGAAEDTPDDLVFDHMQAAAFPDQPMGRPILGSVATLQNVGRDELAAFLGAHYTPQNCVVTAAGAVEHDHLVELAAKALDALPGRGTPLVPSEPHYVGGDRRSVRGLEQSHLVLAFAAPAMAAEGFYETWIFNEILGGGMSSRLFQDIREDRGLVYSIYSSYRAYAQTGLLTIYAGTAPGDAQEVLARTAANVHGLIETVSEAEIARAKAQVKAQILMGLESPVALADAMATDFLHLGRWVPPEEVIARIDAIGGAAVKAAGAAILRQPLSFAAVGPDHGLETYEALAARFETPLKSPS